jgi:hypothetical protein
VSRRWSGRRPGCGLWGLCGGRASPPEPGSRLAVGHGPWGWVLTPARSDADSSSGLDRQRRSSAVGVGGSHRGPRELSGGSGSAAEASLGRRVASMVRCGHDQTGFKQFVDLAAAAGVMPITGSRRVVSESHAVWAWARPRISPSRRP